LNLHIVVLGYLLQHYTPSTPSFDSSDSLWSLPFLVVAAKSAAWLASIDFCFVILGMLSPYPISLSVFQLWNAPPLYPQAALPLQHGLLRPLFLLHAHPLSHYTYIPLSNICPPYHMDWARNDNIFFCCYTHRPQDHFSWYLPLPLLTPFPPVHYWLPCLPYPWNLLCPRGPSHTPHLFDFIGALFFH